MQFIKDEQGEVYKNQPQFYHRFRRFIKVHNRNAWISERILGGYTT